MTESEINEWPLSRTESAILCLGIELHIAAKRGNAHKAVTLLKYGARPNALTKYGWRPVHVAARAGHGVIVKLLIHAGADIELRTDRELTALHCAALSGDELSILSLVTAGADVSAKDHKGRTPLERLHVDAPERIRRNLSPQKS